MNQWVEFSITFFLCLILSAVCFSAGVIYAMANSETVKECVECECYTKFHPVLAEIPEAEPLVEKRMFRLPLDNLSQEKG